jgi:hypothetical protein
LYSLSHTELTIPTLAVSLHHQEAQDTQKTENGIKNEEIEHIKSPFEAKLHFLTNTASICHAFNTFD